MALCLVLVQVPARAQLVDEAPVALDAAERARLQAIIDEPVDPSLPNRAKSPLYARKEAAAFQLRDVQARERVNREWAEFDDEGKWNLRATLARTSKSEEAYRLGQELLQTTRDPVKAVRLRSMMASDYMADGRGKEADALLEQADAIIRKDFARVSLDRGGEYVKLRTEIEFFMSQTTAARSRGRWTQAIEQAKQGADRAQRLMQIVDTAPNAILRGSGMHAAISAMANLSRQQTDAGLYAEAEWTLREAYRQARQWGFHEGSLEPLYQRIGGYYLSTGNYADALNFLERSQRLKVASGLREGSPGWISVQMDVIQALGAADRWDEAAKRLQDVERVAPGRASGQRPVSPFEYEVTAYVQLRTGQADLALPAFRSMVRSRESRFGPLHYFTAVKRGLWAAALAATGQPEEARKQFARSLQGLTAPESLTGDFVEGALQRQTRRYILQSYLQLLEGRAQSDAADAQTLFEVADLLTASSVQQALSEAAVRSGISMPGLADIVRREQDAKNELAALTSYIAGQSAEDERRRNPQVVEQMRARMRELEELRRGYKAQIQKDFPEYFQLVQPRSPRPSDIARQLRADELFIAVVPLGEVTYVWSIDAQAQVKFHKSNLSEAQMGQLVQKVRRTLDVAGFDGRVPAFDFASAHRLYESVFAPLDAQIAGKRHLIVSTSGALAQLPFAVLPRRAHTGGLADAPWLVRDVAVSHVPSATGWLSLKRFNQVPAAPQPMLAWGDPVFDAKVAAAQRAAAGGDAAVRAALGTRTVDLAPRNVLDPATYVVYNRIPPLPETRDEVNELARILGADPGRDLVLGAAATRASVLQASSEGELAKRRVVVFATHGLLAGDLPNLNQPALAMAATGDAQASPLLTLEDVLGLKLNADWVVLSACNTAGADGRAQEAMSGLARGFFYAGSRSLLVTHWSVESQSAMLLTTSTFQAYRDDPKVGRAQALRQAMLKVMGNKDYGHPAFWAPYALVGEGGR